MYKNAIEKINKFYDLDLNKTTHHKAMFDVLDEVIKLDSAGIFYLTPNFLSLEYSKNFPKIETIKIDDTLSKKLYDPHYEDISDDIKKLFNSQKYLLCSRLEIKGAILGILVIERNEPDFSLDEKLIFKTCTKIIANLLKDLEVSKILKMQVKAMEEGIVETHQAYENVKKQNSKIKENEKLQNQFIANVSHDLRTPLNSIIGFSEALGGKIFGDLNDKQSEYVEDIKASGIKLLGMINEILDIAKIESHTLKVNLSTFNISDAIIESCNIITPLAAKKNLTIKKEIEEPIEIIADYMKIEQILLNILSNAIKYAKSEIIISTNLKGENLVISIKDDGIGIPKKHHKKIFSKFFQVESAKTEASTGLGLTIAKEFTKLHDGNISVKSEENQGAEFIIKLPHARCYC